MAASSMLDISSSYGTFQPDKKRAKDDAYDHVPLIDRQESTCERYLSGRWVLCYMALWLNLLFYCHRICISMAIVCIHNLPETEPLNASLNSSLGMDAGEAVWNEEELGDTYTLNDTDVTPPINTKYIPSDMEGVVLSSYYYGYQVTPFLGGMVSERLGAKRVITVAMVISAAATLLTPTAIRFNVYLTVALRVLLGIVAGVLIPALMSMWARWAPAAERAKLVAIGASGTNLGTIVANLVSGYLCGIPVDEGWPFIFYTFGAVTLVWVILWHYLTHDTPNEHPRISDAERDLLEQMNSRTNQTGAKKKIPPLRSIFTSAPFVAMMTTQLCDTWSMCLNVTYLPLYLSEILHFDTATSGVLASLPWVSAFLGTWAFAALADYLHVGHVMSVTKSRKLFQTIGQLGPASILLGYGFISPELRSLAVALMVVLTGLQSACRSGYILNRLDLAPRYAGSLTGLTTTIANIAQIVNPLVTSAIISDHRQESWREIFMITAFLSISGTVIYLIFGSAEEQEWAKDGSLDQTVIYTPSDASLRRSRDQNDSYVTDTRRGGCGHGAK